MPVAKSRLGLDIGRNDYKRSQSSITLNSLQKLARGVVYSNLRNTKPLEQQ